MKLSKGEKESNGQEKSVPWRKNALFIVILVAAQVTILSFLLIDKLTSQKISADVLTFLIGTGTGGMLTLATQIVTEPGVPQDIVKYLIYKLPGVSLEADKKKGNSVPWRQNALLIAIAISIQVTIVAYLLIDKITDTKLSADVLIFLLGTGTGGTLTLATQIVTDPGVPQPIVKQLIDKFPDPRRQG